MHQIPLALGCRAYLSAWWEEGVFSSPPSYFHLELLYLEAGYPGTVVQKPINTNPRLKVDQGVYFSTPRCCSRLVFSKTLN